MWKQSFIGGMEKCCTWTQSLSGERKCLLYEHKAYRGNAKVFQVNTKLGRKYKRFEFKLKVHCGNARVLWANVKVLILNAKFLWETQRHWIIIIPPLYTFPYHIKSMVRIWRHSAWYWYFILGYYRPIKTVLLYTNIFEVGIRCYSKK